MSSSSYAPTFRFSYEKFDSSGGAVEQIIYLGVFVENASEIVSYLKNIPEVERTFNKAYYSVDLGYDGDHKVLVSVPRHFVVNSSSAHASPDLSKMIVRTSLDRSKWNGFIPKHAEIDTWCKVEPSELNRFRSIIPHKDTFARLLLLGPTFHSYKGVKNCISIRDDKNIGNVYMIYTSF